MRRGVRGWSGLKEGREGDIDIRYDATGRTDELVFADAEGGWDEYFNDLFERIDRKALDEDKKKYQGGSSFLSSSPTASSSQPHPSGQADT